jgi:CBS domain containing-hemolysin-like protein
MTTHIIIVLALMLANGLFAGAEIALLSVRKTRALGVRAPARQAGAGGPGPA